ncbi:DMT family transporter [Metabacillus sp. GX 13764]|uniref:DMT family transporter n=1 Tax=Metabacillus kandeliae TaxID=2900151 RepID=UPI001E59F75C|nr:DMT family transporter [Metabacillus kandeliae]MCD7033970.1 DMT family transporter [Metabacillus kandeliae]
MKKLYASLIALSLTWGTSFLFIKLLVQSIGPIGTVFGRCLFGALILLIVLLIFNRQELKEANRLPWLSIIFVGLFNNALPWLLIAYSETAISSSLASVINASTPIFTVIVGTIFFASRLKFRQWSGIFIGFAGILFILNLDLRHFFAENLTGAGTMLLATLCYGIGAHLAKKNLSNLSVVMTSFSTLCVSAVFSLIALLFASPGVLETMFHWDIFFSFIGLGVFGSGAAYLLYYYMVKEGGAEFASLVTYLVPVSAIIWGYFLLKENITLHMILGLLLVFCGIYFITYQSKNKKAAERKTA